MKTEILIAKLMLYFELLRLNDDEITESELDIMKALAKDEQVQAHIATKLKK